MHEALSSVLSIMLFFNPVDWKGHTTYQIISYQMGTHNFLSDGISMLCSLYFMNMVVIRFWFTEVTTFFQFKPQGGGCNSRKQTYGRTKNGSSGKTLRNSWNHLLSSCKFGCTCIFYNTSNMVLLYMPYWVYLHIHVFSQGQSLKVVYGGKKRKKWDIQY